MIETVAARRRGGGWSISLPQDELALHGAGYPLTYAIAGASSAQWRISPAHPWQTVEPLPVGPRVDGIEGVREAGGTLYISKAFPEGSASWYLRGLDASGAEVSAQPTICEKYDNRTLAVVFTYDDTPSPAGWAALTATHAANRLWASPGLNGYAFGDVPPNLPPSDIAAAVSNGYVEPATHGLNHISNYSNPELDQAMADIEAFGGRDAILGACTMPPQSRGRVHGYIYPHGRYPAVTQSAVARSGHLIGRRLGAYSLSPSANAPYGLGAVSPTYGYIAEHRPSFSPFNGSLQSQQGLYQQQQAAAGALASVELARTQAYPLCHIYAYVIQFSWGASDPWPQMLATLGAMGDIWSVGLGHLALYHRTRDQVTVAKLGL